MALIVDKTQISFLANEITKSYMTGKNMGSQDEFAREYFKMYQKSIKIIVEEQQKIQNEQIDVQNIMDDATKDDVPRRYSF